MRLINTTTLVLHDFPLEEAPPYAILSHTWGNNEVNFQDMASLDRFMKKDHEKISRTCSLAREEGLEFAWVDTCCIDKSSSAELGESINSMFPWYMNAVVCYVYLIDLPPYRSIESGISACRWLTRGWTLQELIAPKVVKFYDKYWNQAGTRLDFVDVISKFTRIPVDLLLGRCTLSDLSIATRMSWAAERQTTRVEDMAYCLLGIFEVNLPLIYGEGVRAFRRLQEEIIKRSNDLTIFAWDIPQALRQQFVGLFAPSPAAFAASSSIVPFADDFANFSVTNGGLYLKGDIPLRAVDVATGIVHVETLHSHVETLYSLSLGGKLNMYASDKDTNHIQGGIYLRKIGPKLFCRDGLLPLAGFGAEDKKIRIYEVTEVYILLDPTTAVANSSLSFRNLAIHIPFDDAFHLHEAIPETLWDCTNRIFLRPKRYSWATYPMVLAMTLDVRFNDTTIPLVLLCDYRRQIPRLKVLVPSRYPREYGIIFQRRYAEETISWDELYIQAPSIRTLSGSAAVKAGNNHYVISVSYNKRIVEYMSRDIEVLSLFITTTLAPPSS